MSYRFQISNKQIQSNISGIITWASNTAKYMAWLFGVQFK